MYFVGGHAELVVYYNLECTAFLSDLELRRSSQISVRVVAMAKCQRVYRMVILIVQRAIVHEASNASSLEPLVFWYYGKMSRTHPPAIRINDQHKSIELPSGVYARCSNSRGAILSVP